MLSHPIRNLIPVNSNNLCIQHTIPYSLQCQPQYIYMIHPSLSHSVLHNPPWVCLTNRTYPPSLLQLTRWSHVVLCNMTIPQKKTLRKFDHTKTASHIPLYHLTAPALSAPDLCSCQLSLLLTAAACWR